MPDPYTNPDALPSTSLQAMATRLEERGDYWLSSVRGIERLIPSLGVLTETEATAWVGQMMRSHEDGTFFAAGAFYTFHARVH